MQIRNDVAADAPAASRVLRRSITELCAADHHGDQAVLQRWLSNKTPNIVAGWIARLDSTVLLAVEPEAMLLAVEPEAILGVGAVTDAGEIVLNYVSPDARFRGVSKVMLAALEARAIQLGTSRRRCTARRRRCVSTWLAAMRRTDPWSTGSVRRAATQ